MRASIIIVNWNGRHLLKECLDSVFAQSMKDFEVILVDNASTDGSVEFVRKNYPKVKLALNRSNLGFAEGNNIGIRAAFPGSDCIALLNTDARPEKNWLKALVSAAEAHPEAGSFTPKIVFQDGRINSAGHELFRTGEVRNIGVFERDEGQFGKGMEVFGVPATACLYRRKMLEEARLGNDYFDPAYFAYYEDADLDFRAASLGWKALYVPSATVVHLLGASGTSPVQAYFIERNRRRFFLKNFPPGMLLASLPFFFAYNATRLLYIAFAKRHPIAAARACIDAALGIGETLNARAKASALPKKRGSPQVAFAGTGLGVLLKK